MIAKVGLNAPFIKRAINPLSLHDTWKDYLSIASIQIDNISYKKVNFVTSSTIHMY